jgi:hypothetical protein
VKKPQEVLYDLALWIPDTWRKLGPGQVILRLPKHLRDSLKNLKSDDANIRPDLIWPEPKNKLRQ